MSSKTFGWIQDAGKLSKLKTIMQDFISYESMSVTDSHEIISNSLGIGRWANETYLRFAEALGFIEYDREYDEFIITNLGKKLAISDGEEEYSILSEALLSYAPACRVLELLKNANESLSKFEIAQHLGFKDEAGFPVYGLTNYIIAYHDAENKSKAKLNNESTLDKYARMIAGYLVELGWAKKEIKEFHYKVYTAQTPHSYFITDAGIQAFGRSVGSGTKTKIIKNISYEMLASRKQAGSKILRQRRALILEYLHKRKGKLCKFEEFANYLTKNESEILKDDFFSDIQKLQNIGIQIEKIGSEVILKERLHLNFPIFKTQSQEIQKEIDNIINTLKEKTSNIEESFIEKIVTQAFSGRDMCKEFEDSVFELFNEIIGFEGVKLGGIGKREPDSLFWYKSSLLDGYGLIVDAKAYSKGFRINTDASRQMNDYVYRYTKKLEKDYGVTRSHYLWVTSKYSGKGEIEEFASSIKGMYSYISRGALVSIYNLLLIADKIKNKTDFLALETIFTLGREIQDTDIENMDIE